MNDVDRALTDAVLRGSLKDVKRLLSAKPPNNANPNAQDVAHITPLMRAETINTPPQLPLTCSNKTQKSTAWSCGYCEDSCGVWCQP
ncbi:hypothetical protein Pelo_19734 [Pelomyxa schiedti]|nr:hypothetical protein Pelo_19734 [Pelomyxa schiedti]